MFLNNVLRLAANFGRLVIITFVSANGVVGDDHVMDGEHASLPLNPDFLERYQKNLAEIKQLQDDVRNTHRTEMERLADFRKLRGKYPDYALHLSKDMAADASEKIAELSVSLLGSAVVMSDHKMSHEGVATPSETYMMQRHGFALKALRNAQMDTRQMIRNGATRTLASLSDEIGLQNIIKGAKEGRYSQIDTVNHLGLAKSEVGLELIQPYLQSESADVQAAAVHYMASSTSYRNMIRDRILLNSKAPLEARLAASEHLGSDPRIAMLLLNNGQTPPELFQKTMRTYLNSGWSYSEAELKSLRSILETYRKNESGASFTDLENELNKLNQSNSP